MMSVQLHHIVHDACSIDGTLTDSGLLFKCTFACSCVPSPTLMQNSCIRVQSASTNRDRCDVVDRSVTMQIQEELDKLAQEATANAMNLIKSEKYVFTNNNGYMKLLNKMKEYVMRKQNGSSDEHVEAYLHNMQGFMIPKQNNSSDADARDAKDEVNEWWLPLSMSALSLAWASQACYCACVRACLCPANKANGHPKQQSCRH